MRCGAREFTFLNAGFPVNFDGSVECIPTLLIQPTHGILVAAAYQTLNQELGLHALDPVSDDWFHKHELDWDWTVFK
jgi:hypothetical protein